MMAMIVMNFYNSAMPSKLKMSILQKILLITMRKKEWQLLQQKKVNKKIFFPKISLDFRWYGYMEMKKIYNLEI